MSDRSHSAYVTTQATVRQGKRYVSGHLWETLRLEIQSTAVLSAAGLQVGDRVRIAAIRSGVLLLMRVATRRGDDAAQRAARRAQAVQRWEVRRVRAARLGLSPVRWRKAAAELTRAQMSRSPATSE
ncbi:MAG: hypothetical protein U0587_08665 [Candidatus Binatia bacterium]